MKVLGAGLSRTGTYTLHKAMEVLGYKSIHWAPERLIDEIYGYAYNFKKFDDVDSVTDIPAAYFYRQIKLLYNCKCILTVRDENDWFESIKWHISRLPLTLKGKKLDDANQLHRIVYGSEYPNKELYIKSFQQHNENVVKQLSGRDLLVMNICNGDGWEVLCSFLDEKIPDASFPWEGKRQIDILNEARKVG